MSDREKQPMTKHHPHIHENLNLESDERVRMIYERFHTGRTLIMDDLKYLLMKNPEAFEKLAKSLVRPKSKEGFDFTSIEVENKDYAGKNADGTVPEGSCIDYTVHEEVPVEAPVDINALMASVKSVIENMSDEELKNMSRNVYDPLELLKRIAVLRQLEEKPLEEKMMNNYLTDKDFDVSI